MDPKNRINDLIVISNRLVDVLERENVALSDRKYRHGFSVFRR